MPAAVAASTSIGSWGAEHCADATTLMRALSDAHALGAWLQHEADRGGEGKGADTESDHQGQKEESKQTNEAANNGDEGKQATSSSSSSLLVSRWLAVAEWPQAQARPLITTVLQV